MSLLVTMTVMRGLRCCRLSLLPINSRTSSRLRTQPTRLHQHKIRDAEVLHGPRDGADIPLVLRLHEDDADRRHGALDILYRRYSLACASPSRSHTMEARSSATNASPTGGPSKGSVSPRCVPARSFRIRGSLSSGARAERIGA